MKKAGIFFAALLIVLTSEAYSQRKTTPFQFGFRFAPNIGWLKPDAEEYKSDGISMGYSWGFVGEYKFAENYAICSGFTIPMNSGRLKYPYTDSKDTGTMYRKYNFKAIEIPILLKMQTKEIGYFTYFMQMGLATSINISAKAKDEFDVYYPDPKDCKKGTQYQIHHPVSEGIADHWPGCAVQPQRVDPAVRQPQFRQRFHQCAKGKKSYQQAIGKRHFELP